MPYNLEYYEKMLRQNCDTAREINTIRWNFISELSPKTILDYGSGIGFFRAFRPPTNDIKVYSYDIASYPQTGIPDEQIDLLCFWDVLEHIKNIAQVEDLIQNAKYIALSVPLVKKDINLSTWKHFKPGEHTLYFTRETLLLFFMNYSFKIIKEGTPECPPRTDIFSAIFEGHEKINTQT